MGSFRKSKRSSAATYWAFSSLFVYLVAAVPSHAESGVVSATGTGRDTSEAITNLLRTTVARYFKDQPQLTRAILTAEILPNASSFVQSYKLNEGSKSGAVSLSANVDLDVIKGLLSLTPANIGDGAGAKALVVVKGAKLSDSLLASLKNKNPPDPFAPLTEAGKERFFRREFADSELAADDVQSMGAGEDITSPELLRGLGAKAGARVVLAVSARFESYENENAHNKEERIVLSAEMVDVKNGAVLGRASVNVVNPKSRRDQYISDLEHNISEESKDLFQDVFVSAGRKVAKAETHDEFSVVRVLFPSNAALVARFKTLLEAVPGVRSVVELSVRRGKYDFAVRPPQPEPAFAKAVAALQAADIKVSKTDLLSAAGETEAHAPAVSVKLEPVEQAVPAQGGENANPGPRR